LSRFVEPAGADLVWVDSIQFANGLSSVTGGHRDGTPMWLAASIGMRLIN